MKTNNKGTLPPKKKDKTGLIFPFSGHYTDKMWFLSDFYSVNACNNNSKSVTYNWANDYLVDSYLACFSNRHSHNTPPLSGKFWNSQSPSWQHPCTLATDLLVDGSREYKLAKPQQLLSRKRLCTSSSFLDTKSLRIVQAQCLCLLQTPSSGKKNCPMEHKWAVQLKKHLWRLPDRSFLIILFSRNFSLSQTLLPLHYSETGHWDREHRLPLPCSCPESSSIRHLLGAELSPPKSLCWNSSHSPSIISQWSVLGQRFFKDVAELNEIMHADPSPILLVFF